MTEATVRSPALRPTGPTAPAWREKLRVVLVAILAVASVALAADPASAASKKPEETGVDGSISILQGFTDNVSGDHLRRDGAWYSQLEAQGEWQHGLPWLPDRIGAFARARVYAGYGNRDYAELGPWFGWNWKRLTFDIDYVYSPQRLRVEPDTASDAFADGHDVGGELRSKFGKNKRWTAILAFDFEASFYDASFRERSYYEETVETALHYRLTSYFAPRAGFAYSWRDAISSNYDREQANLLVGFDLYLPYGVRGILRFEKGWRNYIVGYERDGNGKRNNNFGREDDAYEIKTGFDVPIPWIEHTFAHLMYRRYENDSTRVERTYYVNEAELRLSYEF